MSFANTTSPAKWFLYTGIFFRWLCVYLLFVNTLDQFEYTASILPEGYSAFTLPAMIGVAFGLLFTIMEITWMQIKKLSTGTDNTKRQHLNQWAVRYFLAFIFFSYGIAKVLNLQFTSTYTRMDQTLGEANGFWLSWRFFDYSYPYKLFIGLGQVLASTLFLFRRTTTLAAIILLPIISNIVFVNFAFGIGVTFFSACYLVFAIYLLLCDFDRLNALFIRNTTFSTNKALEIKSHHFFTKRSFKLIKAIFIFAIIAWPLSDYFKYKKESNSKEFTGSYNVSHFIYGNNANCPDSIRWDKIFVERWALWGSGRTAKGKWLRFSSIYFNETKHTVQIVFRDTAHNKNINAIYAIEADSSISARGLWGTDSIKFIMKRYFQ